MTRGVRALGRRAASAAGRAVGWLNRLFAGLAGFAMLVMALIGSADVLATNLLGAPIPAAREAIATLMVTAVFLSIPLAQEKRAHIRIEAVADQLPPAVRRLVAVGGTAAVAGFFTLLAWFGWQAAWRSYTTGEYAAGLVNWPMVPARVALALGATLMVAQALRDIGDGVRARRVDTA